MAEELTSLLKPLGVGSIKLLSHDFSAAGTWEDSFVPDEVGQCCLIFALSLDGSSLDALKLTIGHIDFICSELLITEGVKARMEPPRLIRVTRDIPLKLKVENTIAAAKMFELVLSYWVMDVRRAERLVSTGERKVAEYIGGS